MPILCIIRNFSAQRGLGSIPDFPGSSMVTQRPYSWTDFNEAWYFNIPFGAKIVLKFALRKV